MNRSVKTATTKINKHEKTNHNTGLCFSTVVDSLW
jgi:hypothetical protein